MSTKALQHRIVLFHPASILLKSGPMLALEGNDTEGKFEKRRRRASER